MIGVYDVIGHANHGQARLRTVQPRLRLLLLSTAPVLDLCQFRKGKSPEFRRFLDDARSFATPSFLGSRPRKSRNYGFSGIFAKSAPENRHESSLARGGFPVKPRPSNGSQNWHKSSSARGYLQEKDQRFPINRGQVPDHFGQYFQVGSLAGNRGIFRSSGSAYGTRRREFSQVPGFSVPSVTEATDYRSVIRRFESHRGLFRGFRCNAFPWSWVCLVALDGGHGPAAMALSAIALGPGW